MINDYTDYPLKSIEILKFINKNNNYVSLREILNEFPDKENSTLKRLEVMSNSLEISNNYISVTYDFQRDENNNLTGQTTNYYSLTVYGKIYLQDYVMANKRNICFEIVRSLFFPALVALFVTLLTNFFSKWFIFLIGTQLWN